MGFETDTDAHGCLPGLPEGLEGWHNTASVLLEKLNQRAPSIGKCEVEYSHGNRPLKDRDCWLTEVLRCGSTLPAANYLPLNSLKHMGVTFAQETFIDIVWSFGLAFLLPRED